MSSMPWEYASLILNRLGGIKNEENYFRPLTSNLISFTTISDLIKSARDPKATYCG